MPRIDDDPLYCGACGKYFQTPQGTISHLNQARNCAWYRKGKNPEGRRRTMRTPSPELEDPDDVDVIESPDLPVDEVIEEWEEEIYHFIPLPDANQAGPSSAPQPPVRPGRSIDDDSGRIIDSHPTAGRVIRMNENLHTKWQHSFGLVLDADGDVNMEQGSGGLSPFASELDWKIAEWVIKDGPGHAAFDRLLNIPGVRQKLGLSYSNIRGLHEIVDSIPERAEWTSKFLSFPDRPDEKYTIRYRNPLSAIQTLLGNPAHASQIVYVPKRIFTSRARDNRVYNEMWTGKWWAAVQVRGLIGDLMNHN
ncbi:hypothetical protein C8J57DRAFT_1088236 [Mycena rebaudengoi]|nr:hypothetical protein C8J57DRAFT_1088236 [Mycena rebaudengoi]